MRSIPRKPSKLALRASTAIRKETFGYDTTTHSRLLIKHIPDALVELRRELLNHPDIIAECQKPEFKTFEECIGVIGVMLNIAMDGAYEPNDLFRMLTAALKNRKAHSHLTPELQAPGLKKVELVETEDAVTLQEIADDFGGFVNEKVPVGTEGRYDEGKYTICDNCTSSFNCIANRICNRGTPATQLGKTVEFLRESIKEVKR